MAAASAAQPKPAIAADPALSAPGSAPGTAPRNGNGQPAPTTVQPATQANAPTQVQAPRPVQANGGSPAPTQANAKQGANGKEDEEDWWTE
jgi:hypothetical protein